MHTELPSFITCCRNDSAAFRSTTNGDRKTRQPGVITNLNGRKKSVHIRVQNLW